MPLFWLLATLLVAGLLGALLWPLLRRPSVAGAADAPDADVASLAVYRDQKRSLDADLAAGVMTMTEHQEALTELARRLAEEVPSAPGSDTASRRGGWLPATALAVIIPLTAVALYHRLGNPTAVTMIADDRDKPQLSDQQIAAMVASLAQRLKQNPSDAEGWVLLARSYHALERFADAADAYAHASELIHDDPGMLVDYADALAMAQGKSLAGKPAALVQRALDIDPQNRKALALAATGALEVHDLDRSLIYWRRLAATLPAGSEEAGQINGFIEQIAAAKAQGAAPAPTAAGAGAANPAAPSNGAGSPPVGAPGAEAIAGRVEVNPALASKVAPTDTVFIFARAADGPRMPLAVLRIPASNLPMDFTLDDSLSMAPVAKLSGASLVVVEARISKAGTAMPRPGDLYGRVSAIKPGTKGLRIIVDQIVP